MRMGTRVGVRGQLTVAGSLLPLSGSWGWVQVVRLGSRGFSLSSLVSSFSTDAEKYFSCLMKDVQPLKPLTPENYQRRNRYLALDFCCREGQLSSLEPAWQFVENAGLLCKNLIYKSQPN